MTNIISIVFDDDLPSDDRALALLLLRPDLSLDEARELTSHTCADCGNELQAVRPGKWQCNVCEQEVGNNELV